MDNPFIKLEQHMRALTVITREMEIVDERVKAADSLWKVAMQTADGKAEHEQRALLHSLLDQQLDLKARALQLAKDFQT